MKHESLDPERVGLTFQWLDDPATMRIGQTAYVPVYAHKLWNDSGINVVSGQVFNFTVPGAEEWTHGRNRCDADGYLSTVSGRPLEILRHVSKPTGFSL